MKIIKNSIFAAILFGVTLSCSTEIDISAPKVETMAVYGILNPNESVQYIKVFKAFISNDTSALELAQDPSKIYYAADELQITITEKASSRKFIAKPILLDTVEGYGTLKGQDYFGFEGIFPVSPNMAYSLNFTPRQDETYTLEVKNVKTGYTTTSETKTIANFNIRRPFSSTTIPWNWVVPTTTPIEWDKSAGAAVYDVKMYMNAEVRDASFTTILRNETQVVPFARAYRDVKIAVSKDNIYSAVNSNVTPLNDTEVRSLKDVVVQVVAGNIDYERYVSFNEAQNSAGSTQSLKVFTNIKGGVGLFASKYTVVTTPIKLSQLSVDTLACGAFTKGLRYAVFNDPSINPNFPYCD